MLLYRSAINIDTALVCELGDQVVIHELENDKLHLISETILALLKRVSNSGKTEEQLLRLIYEHGQGSSVYDESYAEECNSYLQHLVRQGIIKKLNDSV